jgi:hypothetical protein
MTDRTKNVLLGDEWRAPESLEESENEDLNGRANANAMDATVLESRLSCQCIAAGRLKQNVMHAQERPYTSIPDEPILCAHWSRDRFGRRRQRRPQYPLHPRPVCSARCRDLMSEPNQKEPKKKREKRGSRTPVAYLSVTCRRMPRKARSFPCEHRLHRSSATSPSCDSSAGTSGVRSAPTK